jgi:hypothetical protein
LSVPALESRLLLPAEELFDRRREDADERVLPELSEPELVPDVLPLEAPRLELPDPDPPPAPTLRMLPVPRLPVPDVPTSPPEVELPVP